MRRQCFCGCGRPIPIHRVGLRAHDRRGREMLARLASVREFASRESDDRHVSRWYAKGEVLVAKVAEVVHGERDPWSIDDAERRIWLSDGNLLKRELVARTAQCRRPPNANGE